MSNQMGKQVDIMKMISKIAHLLATGFGVGYIPRAPGTFGSLLGLLIFIPIQSMPYPYPILFLMALFGASVYAINLSLPIFGRKDPREIVIDEIWAILLILFTIPPSWIGWGLGFILFRFFDITKPLPVRKAERLPGGWGVMADDLVAAVFVIVILKIISPLIT